MQNVFELMRSMGANVTQPNHLALLPALARPRYGKYPEIRDPGVCVTESLLSLFQLLMVQMGYTNYCYIEEDVKEREIVDVEQYLELRHKCQLLQLW